MKSGYAQVMRRSQCSWPTPSDRDISLVLAQIWRARVAGGEPQLGRSFRAVPLAALAQLGRQVGSPRVTADDRGFPAVLARMWHGFGMAADGQPFTLVRFS